MTAVYVMSVPHTGTNFVCDSILKDFAWAKPHDEPKPMTLVRYHSTNPDKARIASLMASRFTIIPMRATEAVERSWARRGMDANKVPALLDEARKASGFVLQIDAADRDARLAELSGLLGVPLSTDWSPKGHF